MLSPFYRWANRDPKRKAGWLSPPSWKQYSRGCNKNCIIPTPPPAHLLTWIPILVHVVIQQTLSEPFLWPSPGWLTGDTSENAWGHRAKWDKPNAKLLIMASGSGNLHSDLLFDDIKEFCFRSEDNIVVIFLKDPLSFRDMYWCLFKERMTWHLRFASIKFCDSRATGSK